MTRTPSDRSSCRRLLHRGRDLAARSSGRGEHLLWGRGCAECDLAHSNHGRHTSYFPVSSCGNRHGVGRHGFWGCAALTGSELGFEPGQWDARDYSPNHGDSWQLLCILWIVQIAPQDLHMSYWIPRWSFAKLLLLGPHQRCPGFMQRILSSQGHCGIWKCEGLCLTDTKTGQRHVGARAFTTCSQTMENSLVQMLEVHFIGARAFSVGHPVGAGVLHTSKCKTGKGWVNGRWWGCLVEEQSVGVGSRAYKSKGSTGNGDQAGLMWSALGRPQPVLSAPSVLPSPLSLALASLHCLRPSCASPWSALGLRFLQGGSTCHAQADIPRSGSADLTESLPLVSSEPIGSCLFRRGPSAGWLWGAPTGACPYLRWARMPVGVECLCVSRSGPRAYLKFFFFF